MDNLTTADLTPSSQEIVFEIHQQELYDLLVRAWEGEDPDALFVELYANAN